MPPPGCAACQHSMAVRTLQKPRNGSISVDTNLVAAKSRSYLPHKTDDDTEACWTQKNGPNNFEIEIPKSEIQNVLLKIINLVIIG